MKKYIISILLALSLNSALSQEQFLGHHRADVKETMSTAKAKLLLADVIPEEGISCDVFELDNVKMIFYYRKENICELVMRIHDIKYLKYAVAYLNEQYIKAGDKEWITKDLSVSITLSITEKEFSISYQKPKL